VLGFLALRALLPRLPPFLALLNAFVPFLFAPLLLVLPLAWLARSRVIQASAGALLAAFLCLYAPFFLPRPGPGASHSHRAFTVMTYNLGFEHAMPRQLVDTIADEGADIVAVQELVPATAALVRERLGGAYPYQIAEPGAKTNGLLSRYPILHSRWFTPAGDGRPAIDAVLDVGGAPVRVIVAHPEPPGVSWLDGELPLPIGLHDDRVQAELADVARRAAGSSVPVLFAGDFNMTDQSRTYRALARVLDDAYREAGWGFGFTFPFELRVNGRQVPGPFARLDYVFHSDGLCPQWARVHCRPGSDHCALVVRFVWRGGD
jgi:endonuclease/exonuclease/phosphatase (EEP) superfamily protein YafD